MVNGVINGAIIKGFINEGGWGGTHGRVISGGLMGGGLIGGN